MWQDDDEFHRCDVVAVMVNYIKDACHGGFLLGAL
jgi:hypothetical protein